MNNVYLVPVTITVIAPDKELAKYKASALLDGALHADFEFNEQTGSRSAYPNYEIAEPSLVCSLEDLTEYKEPVK